MAPFDPKRLPVAAIRFLNPAPLMWDFEHPPLDAALSERYHVHYTLPSQCATELHEGRAALGLIPIASLTPELAIVPGCAIASLDHVRSILLIVKLQGSDANLASQLDPSSAEIDEVLRKTITVAADTASRSSLAYAQILFRRFVSTDPELLPAASDPVAMLTQADAAILIGDPALLALEHRAAIESRPGIGPCLWIDLAHEWRRRTGLPWVAAVWAARPEGLAAASQSPARLVDDLQRSRDHGLANIDTLVAEWTPRIELSATAIHHYLTRNIHYTLTPECIATIELFRAYAAEALILPPLPALRFL